MPFSFGESRKQGTRKVGSKLSLSAACTGFFFDPEARSSMFLQNYWLSLNYSVTQKTVIFIGRVSFREGSRMTFCKLW
jgi:hypothetical protein